MMCMIYSYFMIEIFQDRYGQIYFPDRYDGSPCFEGCDPYDLHGLGHVSWVGSVLLIYRSSHDLITAF